MIRQIGATARADSRSVSRWTGRLLLLRKSSDAIYGDFDHVVAKMRKVRRAQMPSWTVMAATAALTPESVADRNAA
jgi:hypothetical protein